MRFRIVKIAQRRVRLAMQRERYCVLNRRVKACKRTCEDTDEVTLDEDRCGRLKFSGKYFRGVRRAWAKIVDKGGTCRDSRADEQGMPAYDYRI